MYNHGEHSATFPKWVRNSFSCSIVSYCSWQPGLECLRFQQEHLAWEWVYYTRADYNIVPASMGCCQSLFNLCDHNLRFILGLPCSWCGTTIPFPSHFWAANALHESINHASRWFPVALAMMSLKGAKVIMRLGFFRCYFDGIEKHTV
jgi:hypothetical protein